ncbi:MAG: PAS domain S-box protein [Phycisphaerae bacterium]|jgi:PAS domain S-box-containing protein
MTQTTGRARRSVRTVAAARRAHAAGVQRPARVPAARFEAARDRLLFEHNLAGVYCTTVGGRILACNESFAEMLGYHSPAELTARNASELYLRKGDRREFLRRLREAGTLKNAELQLRRKDGTPIEILENVQITADERGRFNIIQGTAIDITQRKRVEAALRESEERQRLAAERLRRLARHLQTVREEERGRIARELHDELGQALTALNMELHWVKDRLSDDIAAVRARIESMCELLRSTLSSLRAICADLRPAVLDDFGLIAAMEWQAREFQQRTQIACRLRRPARLPALPNEQATAIFRILQESLTNVARHARARHVRLALTASSGRVQLEVRDDGIGIGAAEVSGPHAMGLAGMRERAARWGGRLRVSGRPGSGTRVVVTMPVAPAIGGRRE